MAACFENGPAGVNRLSRVVNTTFPTGNFTVMWHAFFRFNRTGAYQTPFSIGPTSFLGGMTYLVAFVHASGADWEFGVDGDHASGVAAATGGRWYKQAIVVNGTNGIYYYDLDAGTASNFNATISSATFLWSAGHELWFGNDPWSGGEGVTGKMRCLKAWSRVLGTTELATEAANGGNVADATSLWGQWPCVADGNDTSGNARHLTLTSGQFDSDPDPSAPGTYATIIGVRHTDVTTDATGITVFLPDGSNTVGRLVIVCVTKDGTGAMTWPGGWTQLDEGNDGSAASRSACRYRVIDGTEGFDGVDDSISVTGASEEWHATAATFSGQHASSAPELASATGTSTSGVADPPSLNPANWGVENTLWLGYFGRDASATLPAYDNHCDICCENYIDGNTGGATGVTYGFGIARAPLASVDPGGWSFGTPAEQDSWRAYTIGIRPAGAGGADTPRTPTVGAEVLAGVAPGRVVGTVMTPVTP